MKLTAVVAFAAISIASEAGAQRIERRIGVADSTVRRTRAGVVEGVVTDTNLVPIPMADVRVLGTDSRLYTGQNGRFRFIGIPPRHEIIVIARRIGFAPTYAVLGVDGGDTTRINLALEHLPNLLDTVRIQASLSRTVAGFETRKQRAFGDFFTQDQFSAAANVSNVLRRARGVQLRHSDDAGGFIAVNPRTEGMSIVNETSACTMQIVLDGMMMPKTFPLDHLPSPSEVFGMEVYLTQSGVPAEYQYFAKCGIVFVWTKFAT